MENSAGIGGFGDDINVFEAVALADGSSVVYAGFFLRLQLVQWSG